MFIIPLLEVIATLCVLSGYYFMYITGLIVKGMPLFRADFSIRYLYFLLHNVRMERTEREVGK